MDAWYLGPSFDYYRAQRFMVPETGAIRISASYHLFPQHCILPTLTPAQHVDAVADELFESVQVLPKKKQKARLAKLTAAIRRLEQATEDMGASAASRGTEADVVTTEGGQSDMQPGRSAALVVPPVTTTTNPTNPGVFQAKPRTHLRHTW